VGVNWGTEGGGQWGKVVGWALVVGIEGGGGGCVEGRVFSIEECCGLMS